jgi:hypothetical protein
MAHYNHIITVEDIGEYARPCTIDADVAVRYIEEAEMQDVKTILGDALFFDIAANADKYDTLLHGGTYENGGVRYGFVGLKTALAYYAWARMVKNGVNHLTRFGYVAKNDDYSHAVDWRERQAAYNDAYAVADGYMKECVTYLKNTGKLGADSEVGAISRKRAFFRTIGQ